MFLVQVTSVRIDGLRKEQVYHVHVIQDAEQEDKDSQETKERFAAAAASKAAQKSSETRPDSCTCIEGTSARDRSTTITQLFGRLVAGEPCLDKNGCLDWKNRFEVAGKHGWKLDPMHANKCSM